MAQDAATGGKLGGIAQDDKIIRYGMVRFGAGSGALGFVAKAPGCALGKMRTTRCADRKEKFRCSARDSRGGAIGDAFAQTSSLTVPDVHYRKARGMLKPKLYLFALGIAQDVGERG